MVEVEKVPLLEGAKQSECEGPVDDGCHASSEAANPICPHDTTSQAGCLSLNLKTLSHFRRCTGEVV